MVPEYILNELDEITELLMVLHNYDSSNDLIEEAYQRIRKIKEEIYNE
jgi:hypothetical protein